MTRYLAESWWAMAVRGVLSIVFGIVLFIWPLAGLEALVLVFGAYALVDGAFALVLAYRTTRERWPLIFEGAMGILAGVLVLAWPDIASVALLYVIAAWAVVTGVFEIVAAIRLREVIADEWWLGLTGLISIAFGALLVVWPTAGALAVVWLIGTYAVMFGLTMLFLAWRLRSPGPADTGLAS